MHDRLRPDLTQAINAMSDAEKLELIAELAHSVRSARNGESKSHAVERQRQAFRRLQLELAAIPRAKDPYASWGYSNEAHDNILYDLEQK